MEKVRGIFEKVPGSGAWYIRFADATGHIRKEKAGTFSTAKKLLAKRKTEALDALKLPEMNRRKVPFKEIAADMLEYSKAHKRSHRSDVTYVSKFLPWLGERGVSTIQPQELDRWLSANCHTSATFNRYRASLSLIFKLAERNGKISSNPARKVKQRREDNARLRFITAEEEASLRKYLEDRWPHHWCAVELALHSGMRMGEQFNLKWQDVDFDRRMITLQTTKNGRPRYIPLNDLAVSALRSAEEQSTGQPWVFLNCYGERHVSPRTWFEKSIKELKLKGVTWHTLRHTFASRMAMLGIDLRTLQELLGHKTVTMTLRYTHLTPAHNLAAVQRLCDTKNSTDPRTDPSTEMQYDEVTGTVQ